MSRLKKFNTKSSLILIPSTATISRLKPHSKIFRIEFSIFASVRVSPDSLSVA